MRYGTHLHNLSFAAALIAAQAAATLPSTAALASESDPYFAWIHDVEDSTEAMNARVGAIIEKELKGINDRERRDKKRWSCDKVAIQLGKALGADALAMEFWPGAIGEIPAVPGTPEQRKQYVSESYLGPIQIRDFTVMIASSPTVKIDGIYVGIDKLQHFFSTGRRMYEEYLKGQNLGLRRDWAEKEALKHALFTENSYLGYISDGVFAFADIDADYQGLLLYREWCEKGGLRHRAGTGWKLMKPFDYRNYISPYFDEGFNPSVRRPAYYAFTRERVQRHYCQHRERFEEILEGYRQRLENMPESRLASIRRLRQWVEETIRAGDAPDPTPYTIDSLCAAEPLEFTHHSGAIR